MNKSVAQSMRRFVTLFLILSMRNNAQLSMNNNAPLSMKEFATPSKNKSAIQSMSKFAKLLNQAMEEEVVVAVDLVGAMELEVELVLQLLLLAVKFQDKNVEVFQENSATTCQ